MNRTEWSLTDAALDAIIEIINREGLKRILEFGSGYSTYRLATETESDLDSIEHLPVHADAARNALQPYFCKRVWVCPLEAHGRMLTESEANETRIDGAFYKIPESMGRIALWSGVPFDCVILDGPNGNGRARAFEFLKPLITYPAYILLDDVEDHDFIGMMRKVYTDELLEKKQEGTKMWSIHKITGVV